jgi:hypothetical protein
VSAPFLLLLALTTGVRSYSILYQSSRPGQRFQSVQSLDGCGLWPPLRGGVSSEPPPPTSSSCRELEFGLTVSSMAGAEVPVCPEIRLQEVTLQGLASFAGDLEEHKKLGLVQAVIHVCPSPRPSVLGARRCSSSTIQRHNSPLHLPPSPPGSSKHALEDASPEEAALVQVRAHDLRATVAGWNLHGSFPRSNILRAVQWRCLTTFTSFYMRDISLQEEDI